MGILEEMRMERMKWLRKIKWLERIGWFFFALSVISLLGIFDMGASMEEFSLDIVMSEMLRMPDFKTIILAGISVYCGFKLRKASKSNEEVLKKGKTMAICGALCIVLTFTPVATISSLITFTIAEQVRENNETTLEYEALPEEDYTLYAFLGDDESSPFDVNSFAFQAGYDGSAKGAYDTYKICGQFFNDSNEIWKHVKLEFVLIDADGNDVLKDGQPVVLTPTKDSQLMKYASFPGEHKTFETNTVRAKKLSAQPVGFRVQSLGKLNPVRDSEEAK